MVLWSVSPSHQAILDSSVHLYGDVQRDQESFTKKSVLKFSDSNFGCRRLGCMAIAPALEAYFLRIYIRRSRKRHLHHIRLSSLLCIKYSSSYHADLSSLYHNNTLMHRSDSYLLPTTSFSFFESFFFHSYPAWAGFPTSKPSGCPLYSGSSSSSLFMWQSDQLFCNCW